MKKPSQKKKKKGTRKKGPSSGVAARVDNTSSAEPEMKEEAKKAVSLTVAKKEPEKKPEKKKEKKESVFKYFTIAGQFLREAKMELKKVKWPTRKELLASTAVVIVLVLVLAFFLGLIDFGLIKIIKNIVG